MKIALFVPGGVDPQGGRVIPVILELARNIASRHELLVIATEQGGPTCTYEAVNARVMSLPSSNGSGAFRFPRRLQIVLSTLREHGPFDLLHAIWILGPGTLAAAAARVLGIPLVLSIGGGELAQVPEIGYGGALHLRGRMKAALALRSAAAITGGSRYALATLNGRRERAKWIPLGVNASFYCGEVGRSEGPPWRLVNVGGLNAVKDQGTLLRALRLLRDRGCDARLDCFGVDTLGGQVQALAGALNISEVVTFHGHVSAEVLREYYRSAHLLVQSSRFESMGAAVLEAAACGLPAVGTEVGILAEMAPDSAALCPVADAEKMAQTIQLLLSDRQRRASLAAAQQHFARTYDAEWTARHFEELYGRVTRKLSKRATQP